MDRLKLKSNLIFPLLIIVVSIVLFITNYKPGTFLIGWDNIMPEFDLKLNFLRSIFSIWQEYRGLGVLDGLSHAANFTHTIYIFLLSLFLPDSILRYVFIHLTHLIGGLGAFYFLRKLTKNPKAAFAGSLFYMLNLGIVQMYFAPLEAFAVHFAALPILSLLVVNTLEKASSKNIFFLFLGSFLLSQQGFVPTLFIAFSILLAFILLTFSLSTRKFKRGLLVLLVVVLANAFWAIPYSYSGLNTGKYITESRINQFSSEEIFYRNKSFGDLPSVLSLKGFMIDSIELNPETFNDSYFMGSWRDLSSSLAYKIASILIILVTFLGIATTIVKRKIKYLPYLLTLLIAFIFLANDTPLLSSFNDFIRSSFPLIGEAFRFPFTKFITLFTFCISIMLTVGIVFLMERLSKYKNFIPYVFVIILLFMAIPAFMGNFTSPYLKQKLPNDYLLLFKKMQSLPPQQRVALFPVQTFWNWQYRSWGQRGSGFIWHGLPQPILERAFDPWSPYDEQFYNEIAYAVNTQDEVLFENVINKYDLKYIVLDEYILNTLSKKEINYDSLKSFLEKSPIIKEKDRFNKVILYETNLKNDWIYGLDQKSTKGVYPNYSFEKEDSIYAFTDNYITDTKNPSVVNLFPSLYSEKEQENLEFNVANTKDEYILTPKKSLSYNLKNYILRVPSLFETEFLVPVKVEFSEGELILTPKYPRIEVNGQEIEINEDPITITAQKVLNPKEITFIDIKHTLKITDGQNYSYLLNPAVNSIKLTDKNGVEEVVYLDTQDLNKSSFYATLPPDSNQEVSLAFPKIQSSFSANRIIEDGKYEIRKSALGEFTKPYSKTGSQKGFGNVDLFAKDGSAELTFYLPNLYHQGSYIVFANNQYESGLPMRFYVDNDTQKKAEVEAVFSKDIKETTVVIPKANNYFRGYGFHFIVRSVGKENASSSISGIETFPFPASFVRSLQFIDYSTYENPTNANKKTVVDFKRYNTNTYEAQGSDNSYLVLSQAFDSGWAAYRLPNNASSIKTTLPLLFGTKLNTHILINNWANGWKVDEAGKIIIVYLPSYLQYLGYFLTSLTLVALTTKLITSRRKPS